MKHGVELFKSSLLLTSPNHTPNSKLSSALREASSGVGPFYRPVERISIDEAKKRKSSMSSALPAIGDLSELIHLAMHETDQKAHRPYPAAGGIYSIHLYLLVFGVKDQTPGVYYLRWADKSLELINTEGAAIEFREKWIHQGDKDSIPVIGLMVADTRISQIKYHDRAWRMALIEAGALLQNFYLASSKLKLSLCGLGAISDRAALSLCKLQPHDDSFFACGFALGGRADNAFD